MSVQKTSEVFRLQLGMSEKFVLLKLADCADDRGCNAFPSVQSIAASCGCTERTVRSALRRLETLGLLEVTARATNRRPTVYRVRPERGTVDPWFTTKDEEREERDAALRGKNCPPETEGQKLPPKESEGKELPPSADLGGQLTSARGAAFAPDPSKRDPSKIKNRESAPSAPLPRDAAEALQEIWNRETSAPIPRCRELSPKRRRHADSRVAERPLSEWANVFKRIQASGFCKGQNSRGWVASFAWVIGSADVAVKVLEGNYDDRGGDASTERPPTATERQHAERARKSAGRCFHDPPCESYGECIAAIVRNQRERAKAS